MFKEIRETQMSERLTENNAKSKNYLNIKPQEEMTFETCEEFWAEVFHDIAEAVKEG